MINVETELNLASNVFGKLSEDLKQRIQSFFDNPCAETWDDIYTIIIDGCKMNTIWYYVIQIDTTFPRKAKMEQEYPYKTIWDRIPDVKTVYNALFYATH